MITTTKAFTTSDGRVCATIEEAQKRELALLFKLDSDEIDCAINNPDTTILNLLISERDKVVDILTTTPTSKVRARRVNGGKKTRKPSPEAVNAAVQDAKQ